jgi:hypothetical protein
MNFDRGNFPGEFLGKLPDEIWDKFQKEPLGWI